MIDTRKEALISELDLQAVKSSGPGGQHVNKANTKISLRFSIPGSVVLSEVEKTRLLKKLAPRLTENGELIIQAQSSRSQFANRQEAIQRFLLLIEQSLRPARRRIPTRIPPSKKLKRLENKKKHSEKKSLRRKNLL